MPPEPPITSTSWTAILSQAYALLDDLADKGFPPAPLWLGGGTVLMFHFGHRLSRDIDLFGYDAQWLSRLSPRLNDTAAAMATRYVEQANTIKIVLADGDIDIIVAGDVAVPVERVTMRLAGREMRVDPVSEILAKKLFYRAATLKPRDVYDLAAAIDLDPSAATRGAVAAASKRQLVLQRLEELDGLDPTALFEGIIPFDGTLRHGAGMVAKVRGFLGQAGGQR